MNLSIVVNYKTDGLLHSFIESFQTYVNQDENQLVVVNVAGQGLKVPENVLLIEWESNIGYARAVNDAILLYEDGYENFAIFNADTKFVDDKSFDSCIELLRSDDRIAVVGPLQRNSRGQITHAGIFGTNRKPLHRLWKSHSYLEAKDVVDAVTVSGSAYFIKASVWWELANDPEFKLINGDPMGALLNTDLYYEETFCSYHARFKGYRVVYNGEAEMIHEHDASPISELSGSMTKSREIFRAACDRMGIDRD